MKTIRPTTRWTALAATMFAISACDDTSPTAPMTNVDLGAAASHSMGQSPSAHVDQDVRAWVRGIRDGTRAFKDFSNAAAGGYVAQLSECVESPAGGMGYHYGNPGLIDTQLDPLAPEILLYEPREDGTLRFVGVEFIVPIAAWSDPNPPQVNGMTLHRNDIVGVWALHVWTERHNPTGLFQDFNPKVSCQYAN